MPDADLPGSGRYLEPAVIGRILDERPSQAGSDESGADVRKADGRALGNQPAILVKLMPDTANRLLSLTGIFTEPVEGFTPSDTGINAGIKIRFGD